MFKNLCILFSVSLNLVSALVQAQISVLKIDSSLDAPFFHEQQQQYPKWVVRNSQGVLVHAGTGKKIHTADTLGLKSPATSYLQRTENKLDMVSPDSILSIESRAVRNADTLMIYCAYQSTLSGEVLGIALNNNLTAYVLEGL